jgi:hypothetical protein
VSTSTESHLVRCDLAEAAGTLAHITAEQRETLDAARAALMAGDEAAAHAVSIVLDRTISIPVYRWETVQREFTRLQAKAGARGLPVPMLTALATDERIVTAHVLGGAPVFRGWRLCAELEQRTLEDDTRINLVRTAHGETCPEAYRDAPEQCLHCGLRRRRNNTYVLRHEDGSTMQVGSTCLDEYLGSGALAAWLTLGSLTEWTDGWGAEVFDADEYASYRGRPEDWGADVEPLTFMAAVCAEARVHGYRSAGAAMVSRLATGRLVWAALQRAQHEPVTADDTDRAREILAHIETVRGEFGHNQRVIAGSMVGWRDANTFAAAYPSHAREAARLDEHIPHASVGDRIVLDLAVHSIRSWVAPGFNDSLVMKYMIEFRDRDGRTVVWFTTAPADVEVGDRVRATGKVRRLGSYDGRAQTEMTLRAASIREAGEVKKSAPVMRKWARTAGFPCPEWAWTASMRKKAA